MPVLHGRSVPTGGGRIVRTVPGGEGTALLTVLRPIAAVQVLGTVGPWQAPELVLSLIGVLPSAQRVILCSEFEIHLYKLLKNIPIKIGIVQVLFCSNRYRLISDISALIL